MKLDRRHFLATVGLVIAACGMPLPRDERRGESGAGPGEGPGEAPVGERLDRLFEAHAQVLPERAGAGANHDPMAAEVLEELGHEEAIPEAWSARAKSYAGELPRVAPIEGAIAEAVVATSLGRAERYGDWLDRFRAKLATKPWRSVIAAWAPRLAPGLVGATFHGLLRTAHAARALRRRDSEVRRGELAAGLAYWAASYTELAVDPRRQGETQRPSRAFVAIAHSGTDAAAELEALVREAAGAFLEMLVMQRQRLWLLHTVTGPAAVELLLPEVDAAGARLLVEHARQATVALFAAFGAPWVEGASLRAAPGEWSVPIEQAVASRSVHTLKLIEALARFDRGGDPLHRSVAAQWLEWK